MKVSKQMSDVSGIAILPTQAANTTEVESSGVASFAGVVTSRKGRPFQLLVVNKENREELLGSPYHSREGFQPEGARHLKDALEGGVGYVVRVVGSDATFPSVAINQASEGKNATSKTDLSYHTHNKPSTVGTVGAFYSIEGTEEKRTIDIVTADPDEYGDDLFEFRVHDGDSNKGDILESHIVSFVFGEKIGNSSSFIEDVINRNSKRINFTAGDDVANFKSIDPVTIHCDNGSATMTGLEAAYSKAISILRNAPILFTHVLSLGIYNDTYLKDLTSIASDRVIQGIVDIEPNASYEQALIRAKQLSLNSPDVSVMHLPYSANDPFFEGSRTSWGLSGLAFAAKSKGISKNQPVGGWHYSFAGKERGVIGRSGMVIHSNAGEPDYAAMVKARINKVTVNSNGFLMIDDALTSYIKKNDLRFEHVVSVDRAISRSMFALFEELKHEPDGVTEKQLKEKGSEILDGFVTSGALVAPNNPENGQSPYVLNIKKVSTDLWRISWDISVTGIARRLVGEPRLFS